MLFTLSDTRSTWMVYTAFLAVVALLFFADLADLPIDTHDEDYFLDSADTLAAPAAFFAADKRMPGRPALELVFLLQDMAVHSCPKILRQNDNPYNFSMPR